jgi:hypothetical protein
MTLSSSCGLQDREAGRCIHVRHTVKLIHINSATRRAAFNVYYVLPTACNTKPRGQKRRPDLQLMYHFPSSFLSVLGPRPTRPAAAAAVPTKCHPNEVRLA